MTNGFKILLFTLVILVGIYLLNIRTQSNLTSTSTSIFTNNLDDISKFLIQSNEEAIELVRIDTTWRISGNDTLVIKTRSMDNLFDKVLKVNRGTIISENSEKYNKYSVDDSTGIHLAVINSKDQTVGYYIFGRSNSDYSRSYVRVGDDPKVYLADENVIYMLSTKASYWGEKPKEDIPTPQINTTTN